MTRSATNNTLRDEKMGLLTRILTNPEKGNEENSNNSTPTNEIDDLVGVMNVSDEKIGDSDQNPVTRRILDQSPEIWLTLLEGGTLNKYGTRRLAMACSQSVDFHVVCSELVRPSTFAQSIVNEIMSENNWNRIQTIIDKSLIKSASQRSELAYSLRRLFSSGELWIVAIRILFSAKVVKGVFSVFSSGDISTRKMALDACSVYPIEISKELLTMALEDPEEEVRNHSISILKLKLPFEDVYRLIESGEAEAKELRSLAERARDTAFEYLGDLPGISTMFKAINAVIGGGANIASTISNKFTTSISTVVNVFATKADLKEKEGLIALSIAIAWTDGIIEKSERDYIESLMEEFDSANRLRHWLHIRPSIDDLKGLFKQIKSPQDTLNTVAKAIQLCPIEQMRIPQLEWLAQIEKALDAEGVLIDLSHNAITELWESMSANMSLDLQRSAIALMIGLLWSLDSIPSIYKSVLNMIISDHNLGDDLLKFFDKRPSIQFLKEVTVKLPDKLLVFESLMEGLNIKERAKDPQWLSKLLNILY